MGTMYDVEFSVAIIDRTKQVGENQIVDDGTGYDLASKLLGRTDYKTFKAALRAAQKLRKLHKEHEIVVTPMFNVLDEEGEVYYGSGQDCISIKEDGTITPLEDYFTE